MYNSQHLHKNPHKIQGLEYSGFLQIVHFSFNTLEEGYKLAEYISSFFETEYKNRVELGLKEVFFNAIEHGNLGISAVEKQQLKQSGEWLDEFTRRAQCCDKKVDVCFNMTPEYASIKVCDQGEGFDWRQHAKMPYSLTSYNGRGLLLAKEHCFDRLEFSEKGNQVSCLIYLNLQSPHSTQRVVG